MNMPVDPLWPGPVICTKKIVGRCFLTSSREYGKGMLSGFAVVDRLGTNYF